MNRIDKFFAPDTGWTNQPNGATHKFSFQLIDEAQTSIQAIELRWVVPHQFNRIANSGRVASPEWVQNGQPKQVSVTWLNGRGGEHEASISGAQYIFFNLIQTTQHPLIDIQTIDQKVVVSLDCPGTIVPSENYENSSTWKNCCILL